MMFPSNFVPNKKDLEYFVVEGGVYSCEVQSSPHFAFGREWVVDNRTTFKLEACLNENSRPTFVINNAGLYIPVHSYVRVQIPKLEGLDSIKDFYEKLTCNDELLVAGVEVYSKVNRGLIEFRYVDFAKGKYVKEEEK
ncbi:MAG: hypothetical protein AABW73_01210 [Nanoarchaeota archaeon]